MLLTFPKDQLSFSNKYWSNNVLAQDEAVDYEKRPYVYIWRVIDDKIANRIAEAGASDTGFRGHIQSIAAFDKVQHEYMASTVDK